MEIREGVNSEYGRGKFDVTLDEGDLTRMLLEAGLPPDACLTTAQAFALLRIETRLLVLAQCVQFQALSPEQAGIERQGLLEQRKQWLDFLLSMVTPEQPGPAAGVVTAEAAPQGEPAP
jgi:hypothetical protein